MSDTFFGKDWQVWINRYAGSHTHPINRLCHSWGIPMIVVSLVLIFPALWFSALWPLLIGLFLLGWALQFIGHIFERKWPEFFYDWRFLFVGLRWWVAKMQGKV